MTNTHINVGGHKITTNKVGTVHDISANIQSPWTGSGSVKYCVTNGWCQIRIWGVQNSYTDWSQRIFCTGVPKAKVGVASVGRLFTFYVFEGETQIIIEPGYSGPIYQTLEYAVADDWVES